jgi:hypothetical protein
MLPGHLDGGFHIVCQDDELGRSVVVMGAETHDIYLSHSGRENSEKLRGEQGGPGSRSAPLLLDGISKATDNMIREPNGGPDGKKDDFDVHAQV